MEQTSAVKAPLFSRRDLKRLLIPLIVEQLLMMTIGMADTMMVTSAGEAVVSGVSLVDNINILIINIFSALSTGGAVVVSQFLGRQDVEKARSAAKQLMHVALLVGLALMAVALIFREGILRLVFGNISGQTMDAALAYFLLTAAAYPFIAVYNAGAALFRSMGNSKVSMFNSLIVNVINISVNYVMIYRFHLGAAGAGVGTLVSRMAAAIVITWMITRPAHLVYIEKIFKPEFRWPMVRAILGIGIPNGIENGMFQIGKLLVLGLITSFDVGVDLAVRGSAVAANAIANAVAGLVNIPGTGIGLGMITVVGQCIGAGDERQAMGYTKKLMLLSYAAMDALVVILFFTAPWVVGFFSLTPPTAALATQLLRICAVVDFFLWPAAFVLPNALRAAGDAKFTMVVSMLSMWICRIGFSYLLGAPWGLDMGLMGVWIAMFIDWIARIIPFVIRLVTGGWKGHKVI